MQTILKQKDFLETLLKLPPEVFDFDKKRILKDIMGKEDNAEEITSSFLSVKNESVDEIISSFSPGKP